MDLDNFDLEIERGCQYFVTSNRSHRASYSGIITAPFFEQTEVMYEKDRVLRIKYNKIPIRAIRSEVFDIADGERGDLVNAKSENGKIKSLEVRWKSAIHVYYANPMKIQIAIDCRTKLSVEESWTLEDFFKIEKIEPPNKA